MPNKQGRGVRINGGRKILKIGGGAEFLGREGANTSKLCMKDRPNCK